MGSETGLWGYLRPLLVAAGADVQRIESPTTGDGIPDVNGCSLGIDFWIELKHVEAWPKRAGTPVRIPHYTDEQRRWLARRGRAGGRAMLLVRVARTVMLFNWLHAQRVGRLNRAALYRDACGVWEGRVDAAELLWLCRAGACINIRTTKKSTFKITDSM